MASRRPLLGGNGGDPTQRPSSGMTSTSSGISTGRSPTRLAESRRARLAPALRPGGSGHLRLPLKMVVDLRIDGPRDRPHGPAQYTRPVAASNLARKWLSVRHDAGTVTGRPSGSMAATGTGTVDQTQPGSPGQITLTFSSGSVSTTPAGNYNRTHNYQPGYPDGTYQELSAIQLNTSGGFVVKKFLIACL